MTSIDSCPNHNEMANFRPHFGNKPIWLGALLKLKASGFFDLTFRVPNRTRPDPL